MLFKFFLLFCAFLPFQFALNLTEEVDLAIARVIIIILFIIASFNIFKEQKEILKEKPAVLILVFLLLAAISVSFSERLSWSLRKLLFLLTIFPIYFVTASIVSKENVRKILITLVLGASALAFTGIMQFLPQFIFGIDPVYDFWAKNVAPFFLGNSFSQAVLAHPSWLIRSAGATYMRAFAIFPDPHMFSFYLEMLLPFSIALWATSTAHKKVFIFSSFLIIAADILSFTRGSYIALICGAVATIPFVSKSISKKLIGSVAILFLLFIAVPHNPVSQRFISSFDFKEGSNVGRMENWEQAITTIISHPLGVGIGMYSLSVDPNAEYRTPIYAHNLYLDIAAELGLLALLAFAGLLFFTFFSFVDLGKSSPILTAGISSIAVFSAHSFVETPLYSVHVLTLLAIIIALPFAFKKYEEISNN